MTDDERKYWIGFSCFPGIGPLRFKLIREFFGSAKSAWYASQKDLLEIKLPGNLVADFITFRSDGVLNKYLEVIREKDISILTLPDKDYPKLLSRITSAPFVLYIRGLLKNIPDFGRTIAVVGTRTVTDYGRTVTSKLTTGLVDKGLTIVSGMAMGVDTAAHETAIEHGGKTIAVLGCGIDMIHPASNAGLYWDIIEKHGIVVSEFPPGMTTSKGLFPARNRIISGLSLGVVVTEGAKDSGAMITANYAAEQGREVFAVPGPITSYLSDGPINLIRQGAKLVTGAEDILEELNIKYKISNIKNTSQISNMKVSKEENIILELLQGENMHFDEIVRRTGIESGKLGGMLTILEMKGIIKNLGNGNYSNSTLGVE